jgi:hypothetical protein
MTRSRRLLLTGAALLVPTVTGAQTPQVLNVCYQSLTGLLYVMGLPGTPTSCRALYRELSWTDANGALHSQLSGLAADDHPQYLLGDGVRRVGNGFAVASSGETGEIPWRYIGPHFDRVLMWYPAKAAFRAGEVFGNQWDDANIGQASTALGRGVVASGGVSTAIGDYTVASGDFATAMGSHTAASGEFSTAMGSGTVAAGGSSTAMGSHSRAEGFSSAAMGGGWTHGDYSLAMGDHSYASDYSVAMGYHAAASGQRATALGSYASSSRFGAFVYGDASTTSLVISDQDNQFTVRASGGFRFRTSSDLSTGCDLPAGSGSWDCTSSRLLKANLEPLDDEDVLTRVRDLPVMRWSYLAEPGVRHVGTFAEDFHRAFGLGTGVTSIGMIDMDGVNLAAVKALERRTRELQQQLDVLGAGQAVGTSQTGWRAHDAYFRDGTTIAPSHPGRGVGAMRGAAIRNSRWQRTSTRAKRLVR